MPLVMEASVGTATFPYGLIAITLIGFLAAITFGSLAWYNSKRPIGWKDKERPDFVPKVDR
ncbi:hypothetical protein K4A83_14840 [Spirulina subsalsa FACHB-351]|uniref:Uncharacterized protein n=1 Tax=Spirulina subsalsa FACHB-351 TaxID=234711 RepID=A0ABT3L8R2_9CYAN|nr:hypothetical protein [Spirulina subsalsa]MCW6037542.1 hypothetical protein [Spirulina subsalsa FACHB-351]